MTLQGRHLDVAQAERDAAIRMAAAGEASALTGRDQIAAAAKNVATEIGANDVREWQFQRARISADDLDITLEVGRSPLAVLHLQNSGHTSAQNVNVWHRWINNVGVGHLPNTPTCDKLPQRATLVITHGLNFNLKRTEFWSEEESKKLSIDNPITILGSICYLDERGQRHQTTFCRFATENGKVSRCDVGERQR